jgi:hypothetical protein
MTSVRRFLGTFGFGGGLGLAALGGATENVGAAGHVQRLVGIRVGIGVLAAGSWVFGHGRAITREVAAQALLRRSPLHRIGTPVTDLFDRLVTG